METEDGALSIDELYAPKRLPMRKQRGGTRGMKTVQIKPEGRFYAPPEDLESCHTEEVLKTAQVS